MENDFDLYKKKLFEAKKIADEVKKELELSVSDIKDIATTLFIAARRK